MERRGFFEQAAAALAGAWASLWGCQPSAKKERMADMPAPFHGASVIEAGRISCLLWQQVFEEEGRLFGGVFTAGLSVRGAPLGASTSRPAKNWDFRTFELVWPKNKCELLTLLDWLAEGDLTEDEAEALRKFQELLGDITPLTEMEGLDPGCSQWRKFDEGLCGHSLPGWEADKLRQLS